MLLKISWMLVLVNGFLKYMCVNDWHSLGLQLRLFFPTLERIEKEQHGTLTCLHNRDTMVSRLYTERRQVTETSVSCWAVLKLVLVNIGEPQQLAIETPVSCCVCIRACTFTMHVFIYSTDQISIPLQGHAPNKCIIQFD